MKKYIKIALVSLFIYMCFKSVWIAFLTDIVPREYTFFFSYEQFCKKADDYFLNETKPASADHLKYYWYNGWFNKLRGIRMTLSEEDYQKEKEYYRNWLLSRVPTIPGVETYLYNAADPKYVDGDELEEKGLGFINSMIDLDKTAYYYVVMEDDYSSKGREEGLYAGEGVLANDETRELLVYSYQLYFCETDEKISNREETR